MNKVINTLFLDECLSLVIDNRGKTPKKLKSDWVNIGYRTLSANNVKFSGLEEEGTIRCIDESTYRRWMKDEIERGDILLTSEAPAGQVMYWNSDEKVAVGQRLFCLRTNEKLDSKYLKYYLQSPTGQFEIIKNTTGSTVFGISAKMFEQIVVKVPEKNIQENIGSFLFSLDSKIEINNRINAELEAMVKTLYDYWFVQFDFPNAEGKPYKSSGGKMVWNEKLKRDIPEGWLVENIEKCCQIIDCLHSKKPGYCFEEDKYYLLQLENLLDNGLIDVSSKYYVSSSDYAEWTSRIEVKENDILITNAGRVAATTQVPREIISGIGRNITAIRPVAIKPTYLFLTFRGYDILRQIKWNTDSGAFFSSFNVKGIKKIYVIRPPKEIEDKFERIVFPLRRKRELQLFENLTFSSLRDWLLPMLMNGQVKVN